MCKDAKSELNEVKESTTELSQLNATPPSSDSDVIMFCEPLLISTDNLAENVQLDKDEFIRGLKDASYFSGMYTGLINSGISMEDTVALIFNFINVNHNIETTKISSSANIEVSKNVAVSKEKELL